MKATINAKGTEITVLSKGDENEESVDFDTTKNLFIEGDNLDAMPGLRKESRQRPVVTSMIGLLQPYPDENV